MVRLVNGERVIAVLKEGPGLFAVAKFPGDAEETPTEVPNLSLQTWNTAVMKKPAAAKKATKKLKANTLLPELDQLLDEEEAEAMEREGSEEEAEQEEEEEEEAEEQEGITQLIMRKKPSAKSKAAPRPVRLPEKTPDQQPVDVGGELQAPVFSGHLMKLRKATAQSYITGLVAGGNKYTLIVSLTQKMTPRHRELTQRLHEELLQKNNFTKAVALELRSALLAEEC